MQKELDRLNKEIEQSPTALLHVERGKLYSKGGVMDKALNDFLKAEELDPDNTEATEYIRMLREVFEFRYKDYYNP